MNAPIICSIHKCDEKTIRICFDTDRGIICRSCRIEQTRLGHSSCSEQILKLPSPFRRASDVRNDLVLITSKGTFLDDYNVGRGLHIGITRDDRTLLEFSSEGLAKNTESRPRWRQCLGLNILERLSTRIRTSKSVLHSTWNQSLDLLISEGKTDWSSVRYDSELNNCFDFALAFLAAFVSMLNQSGIETGTLEDLNDSLRSKSSFCQYFVIPETRRAARYISLHRKLKSGATSINI